MRVPRHVTSGALALAVITASVLSGVVVESSSAAPFAATASVAPQEQYLGDSAGTTFTLTVNNTGTVDTIGAVQITRPSNQWTVTACPSAPPGWTGQRSDTMCRYRSAAGTADDLRPGQSSSAFKVTATSKPGNRNRTSTWNVKVSRSSQFDSKSKLIAAASTAPGLTVTAYSFQVLDAVVDPGPVAPGDACPAANKAGTAGSTGHTIVICGRNRTTGTLIPTGAHSSLAGTFLSSHGAFTSGAVAPTASSVVLGSWADATITSTAGANKTVIAKIGSASDRTSPLTTLTGYEALNNGPAAPNAVDDADTVGENSTGKTVSVLANDTDPNNDTLTVTAVDTTSTQGSVTNNGTDVTYDPNGQFESLGAGESATDTFTYTVSDGNGGTDSASVTITVNGVNDAPNAVNDDKTVGEDSTGATVDVLANDTDPESDALTVSAVDSTGTTGSVTNSGTDVTYDPNGKFENLGAGDTATDTFTYTVSDGNGGIDTATVTVTITGAAEANRPPVATGDADTVGENSTRTAIDVLANDTDDENDTLAVSAVDTTGTTGTVTNNGTDVTYDPNGQFESLDAGESATDTFTYTVSDGNGGTDTATVTITLTGVNDAPNAVNDLKTVSEDSTGATVDVLANDTDPDDSLTITSVSTPDVGSVTNNGTDVTYDPNGAFEHLGAGETGVATFTYTISDGTATDTATVTVTITGVNDDPVAVDDIKTVGEDSTGTTVAVLTNDSDAEGALVVSSVDTTGTTGVVTNNGTDVTYDPNGQFENLGAGDTATDTFTYTVSDSQGATDTATVTITITGAAEANRPPVAVDDANTVGEDSSGTTIGVLGNDTDPDADTLTVSAVNTTGTTGQVTNNGTDLSYDPNGQFEHLGVGDTATDTFTYTVSDGTSIDTATVTVTITGVNDDPVAVDDIKTVGEDSTGATVDVLTNDTDAEGTVTVTAINTTIGTLGQVTNNGTDITYDPNGQFENLGAGDTATDTFTYTISDGNGGTDTATVTITITGAAEANRPPVAVDDANTVGEGSSGTTIGVLGNDTDPDGNTLTVSAVNTTGTAGTVTNNGTDVTYDPNGAFENLAAGQTATDTFSYTASDGTATDSATVTVTITGVNDPPVAVDDIKTVGEDSTGTTVNALGNDTDVESQTLTVTAIDTTGTTGTVTNNGTDVTYDPNSQFEHLGAGQTATDTFTYTVSDSQSGTDTATVTITITGVNDSPVAVNDIKTVGEDSTGATVDVLTNDTDAEGAVTVTAINTTGTTGMVTNNGTDVIYDPNGGFESLANGESDTDTFTYTVSDSQGGTDSATVTVTITGVNDPPVAVDDIKTVGEDSTGTTVNVLGNDTDAESQTLTVTAIDTTGTTGTVTNNGTDVTYDPNGQFEHLGAGQTATDTFTYTASDSQGGSDTATITITITGAAEANRPPVAVDDANTVGENSSGTTIGVLGNDTDPDPDTLTVSAVDTTGTTGAVTNNGADVSYDPNGQFESLGAGQTATDTFTYTVSDGTATDTATVTVTIFGVDDAPVAVNDSATVAEDANATAVNVLTNDTDIDAGPKTISAASDPANGTVVLTGGTTGAHTGLTYRPDANYCNQPPDTTRDTFTYTLNGGSTATVSVAVTCVDDAPVAVNDSATVLQNASPAAVAVLTNDTDIDGGPKTIASVTQPTNGTVVIAGGGTGLTYAPDPGYCNTGGSPETFTYTLNGGSSATVSITVTCGVNRPPDAVDDANTVGENSSGTTIGVLGNDTDPDNDTLTIIDFDTTGTSGQVTSNGTDMTYDPNGQFESLGTGQNGTDTFTYTITDGAEIDTATVTITISGVDDAPVAVNDSSAVAEDANATPVNVLTNDTDIDAGPKTIGSVTQPANGTVVITGGGTGLTYRPNPNYCNNPPGTSPSTFTYTLNGGSTATVSVTVTCVDDNPVAVNDIATVAEDANATAINVLTNDTDIDAGPKTIASVTQPTNGTVVITGGGAGLTYAPAANYCNAPPGTTLSTFTYTLNGGSTATVSVTVTCLDDNPTAVNDNATVLEDAPAAPIAVLTNDTDVDGGPRTISAVTQPTNGTVVITGGGAGLTYAPAANYCNTPPGTTLSTFTYTLNGGSTATVNVTVTCVDDTPTAVNDSASVAEDANATAIAVLANDTDIDAGPKTIASATQPTNGTVVLTGGTTGAHTGLTYRPDPNYCNNPPGTSLSGFTYTLNGGSTATVIVTVTCVDDAPVAVNDSATVTEDANATAIAVLTNDTDIDAGPKTISSATQPANGTVVLTGGTAGARTGLTYAPDLAYCNNPPGTAPDTFTYTLNGGSTATVSITVTCVAGNHAPDAVNDNTTINENVNANSMQVLINDSDPDGDPLTVVSVTQPTAGVATAGTTTVGFNPSGQFDDLTVGESRVVTFTYTISDGNGGSDTATITVTVLGVNSAPVIANVETTVVQYIEEQAPVPITATGTVSDVDSDDFSTGTLTASISTNGHADDRLGIRNQGTAAGQIGVSGSNVSHSGVQIGTFTGGTSGTTPLVVTLNSAATPSATQALLRNVTFSNVSQNPTTSDTRIARFVLTDGDGGTSNAATRFVVAANANDTPVIANVETTAVPYVEHAAAVVVTNTATVSDIDNANFFGGALSVNVTPGGQTTDTLEIRNQGTAAGQIGVSGGTVTYGGVAIGTFTGGTGSTPLTVSFNLSSSPAAAQALVRNITYRNDGPDAVAGNHTVRFVLFDGDGGVSDPATRNVAVTPTNDAPFFSFIDSTPRTYVEDNSPETIVTAGHFLQDLDSPDLGGGTITLDLTAGGQAEDRLEIRDGGTAAGQIGVTGANVTYGGVLVGTFTGGTSGSTPLVVTLNTSATPTVADRIVKSLTFRTIGDAPSTTPRTARVVVTDGDGGTSLPLTKQINVIATNDAPVIANVEATALTYVEGTAAAVVTTAGTITDPDSVNFDLGSLTVDYSAGGTADDRLAIRNQGTAAGQIGVSGANVTFGGVAMGAFTGGTGTSSLVVTLNATATPAAAQALLRNIVFSNLSNTPAASRTVRFVARDGDGGISGAATRVVNVTGSNDPPVIAAVESTTLGYVENAAATVITGTGTVADPDSADFATGTLTVNYSVGGTADDRLEIRHQGTAAGQIGVSGANVSFGGVLMGTFTGGSGSTPLVITLNATATPAATQALLRDITYRNVSDNPSTAARTVRFVLTDGDGGTSTPATRNIAVTAVNDAPVIAAVEAGALAWTQTDPPTVVTLTGTIADADSADLATGTLTADFSAGGNADDRLEIRNQGVAAGQIGVSGANVTFGGVTIGTFTGGTSGTTPLIITLNASATPAAAQALLRNVTYRNVAPVALLGNRTVRFVLTDGDGGTSAPASRTVTVSATNHAPLVFVPEGTALAYAAGSTAAVITPGASVFDSDSANFAAGTLTVASAVGGTADDRIEIRNQGTGAGQIGVSASNVTFGGVTIGTFTGGVGTTPLVVTFNAASTPTIAQALVQNITFRTVTTPPGVSSRFIQFVVSDGDGGTSSPAGRNVTVTGPAAAPVVTLSGSAPAFTEDAPAVTIDSALTVTDADSATLVGATFQITGNYVNGSDLILGVSSGGITSSFDAATGTLTLTGTDAVVTYENAMRFVKFMTTSNTPSTLTRSITITVNDGTAPSALVIKPVTVTAVNDAPSVGMEGAVLAYTENAPATPVTTIGTVTDPDSADFSGGNLTADFSVGGQAEDRLAIRNQGTGAGQIGVSGANVTFAGVTIGTFAGGTSGTTPLVVTFNANATPAAAQALHRNITYQNVSDTPVTASRTVRVRVADGDGGTSGAAIRTITITAVDDAPVVTASAGSTAYTEQAAQVIVDPTLTVTDVDSANATGATVTIGSPVAGDVLNYVTQGTITGVFSSGVLTLSGTATVAQYQAALRTVAFANPTSNAPGASRTIGFRITTPVASNTANKTIAITQVNDAPVVNLDAAGALTYAEQAGFVNAFGPAATVTDPDSATLANLRVTVTAGFDAAFDTVRLNPAVTGFTSNFTAGVLTLAKAGGTVAEYQNALRNVQFSNTDNDPDNRNDGTANPTDANRTLSVVVNDGSLNSSTVTRGVTITPVNDAPGAPSTLPTVTGIRNTTLVSTGVVVTDPHATRSVNLIGNAADPDGLESAIGVVPVASAATAQNGTIIVGADGSLRYYPPFSMSLTSDTYGYSLTDGTTASSPITFTVNLSGSVVYVADRTFLPPPLEDGTANRPFDTLAEAVAVTGSTTIHIRNEGGDNAVTGGIVMGTNEKLIGAGVALTNTDVGSATAETLYPASTKPVLHALNVDVVRLASNTEVAGVSIDPNGGGGIYGDSTTGVVLRSMDVTDTGGAAVKPGIWINVGGVTFSGTVSINTTQTGALLILGATVAGTISSINVSGATSFHGIALSANTGSLTISNANITTTGVNGINLGGAGTVQFPAAGTVTVNTTGEKALNFDQTNLVTSVFDSITVSGSSRGAVLMTNTTGSTTFGDGVGTDLALTTVAAVPVGPAQTAFKLNNAGTVVVPAAGTANVSATTSPAIDVQNTSGATLAFDDVDSINSTTDGVILKGLDAGTFTANASSNVTGYEGVGFNIVGGTGAITYAGAISNGPLGDQVLNMQGRTGGAVTFSGPISDTAGAGGGILLLNNTGGTTTFSGTSKVLNTGTANAVFMSGSTNHTLTLSGGGLDIDTTSGFGIRAELGGTIAVSGTGNTITTSTGQALHVVSTTIGAGGLTFQSMSTNGALSGIVLSGTGSLGGLTVTGVGTADCVSVATCTGGSIQSSTGPGIELSAMSHADSLTLTNMLIQNGAAEGIRASTVVGVDLTNVLVHNNGDALAESGVELTNVTGTGSLSNSTLSQNSGDNLHLENNAGSTTFSVTGSAVKDGVLEPAANDGILASGSNAANITLNVTGSNTFSNPEGDHIQVATTSTATGTYVTNIQNNTFTNTPGSGSAGSGITITNDGSTQGTLTFSGNTVTNAVAQSIIVSNGVGNAALTRATIENNTIGDAITAGSGGASGIALWASTQTSITALIRNNTIRNWDNLAGAISVLSNDTCGVNPPGCGLSGGAVNVTIKGNTIANPGADVTNGIFLSAGATSDDTNRICADVGGALAADKNSVQANEVNGGSDIAVRQRFGSTFRMPGYTGTATGGTLQADIFSYLSGRNTITTTNAGTPGGTGYQNTVPAGSACLLP